jgi:4-amino-4-deoxy-L-arabinose transferase-like glycosyltransferase
MKLSASPETRRPASRPSSSASTTHYPRNAAWWFPGNTAVILLITTIFALALRVANLQGFLNHDDVSYVGDALRLAEGHFVPGQNPWDVRIGIIAPTALILRLFGLHLWSLALYPLMISLASVWLMYAMGKLLFGRQVGLIAALLLACFPEDIYWSTVTYPNLPGAFYGASAVLLALLTIQARSRIRGVALGTACGLALGASYLNWEANLMFAALCILIIVRNGVKNRIERILSLMLALLCTIGVESFWYWELKRDAFFRLAAMHSRNAMMRDPITITYYLLRWPDALLFPAHNTFNPRTFFYVLITAWAAVAVLHDVRSRNIQLLLVWLVGMYALIAYAVLSIHPLIAAVQVEPRFMFNVMYPAILVGAVAIWHLWIKMVGEANQAQCRVIAP